MFDVMDSLEIFTEKLLVELDSFPADSLKPDTHYRQLPEWSSMHVLIIIAFCETEYGITVTGEDLRGCSTLRDLHNLLLTRL